MDPNEEGTYPALYHHGEDAHRPGYVSLPRPLPLGILGSEGNYTTLYKNQVWSLKGTPYKNYCYGVCDIGLFPFLSFLFFLSFFLSIPHTAVLLARSSDLSQRTTALEMLENIIKQA